MTGRPRDAFGDPAYLDGALGRLETGQPLRAVDLQELSYAIGRDAALKLARTVEEDRARAARRPSKPSGLWGWFFGPIHTAPQVSPLVARLVARLRAGQPLTGGDARSVARSLGRAAARAVSRRAARRVRATARGVSRVQVRTAGRRARRGR